MAVVSGETWHRVCICLHVDVKLLFYLLCTCTDEAQVPGGTDDTQVNRRGGSLPCGLQLGPPTMSGERRASFRVLMKSAAERPDVCVLGARGRKLDHQPLGWTVLRRYQVMPGMWPIRPHWELWWDVRRSLLTHLDVPGESKRRSTGRGVSNG